MLITSRKEIIWLMVALRLCIFHFTVNCMLYLYLISRFESTMPFSHTHLAFFVVVVEMSLLILLNCRFLPDAIKSTRMMLQN
jgi:hypothetical protein